MNAWNSFSKLSQRILRRLRQERGQALVEFAIILPVLVLLILGILYFGRYENYANQETQLAEQAARQAAVNVNPATSGTLQAYILSQASGELQAGSGDVTSHAVVYIYYPTGSTNAVGKQVTACVVATVRLPFGGLTQLMTQSATMRLEQVSTVWTESPSVPASCPSS